MDDTSTATATAPPGTTGLGQYISSYRNLAWSFRASRDTWKRKYQDQQRHYKRLQNQVHDVRCSREQWRAQAAQAQKALAVAHAEVAALRQALAAAHAASEKKG
jgi:chromosome segregation ATPase